MKGNSSKKVLRGQKPITNFLELKVKDNGPCTPIQVSSKVLCKPESDLNTVDMGKTTEAPNNTQCMSNTAVGREENGLTLQENTRLVGNKTGWV